MAAHKAINPDQLRLFYTGREMQDMLTGSGDLHDSEDMPDMWDRKLDESMKPPHTGHGAGVYESIKEKGYQGTRLGVIDEPHWDTGEPVTRVNDGHHRIAAAELERTTGQLSFFPVVHYGEDEHHPWAGRITSWEETQAMDRKHREIDRKMHEEWKNKDPFGVDAAVEHPNSTTETGPRPNAGSSTVPNTEPRANRKIVVVRGPRPKRSYDSGR